MIKFHLIPGKTCGLLIVLILAFPLVLIYGCNIIQALGKNPSGEALKKVESLPNYKNGQFQNLYQNLQDVTLTVERRKPRWLSLLKFFVDKPKRLLPSKPLVAVNTDLINTTFNKPTIIWFGHS